jgi:integrase
LLSLTLRDFDNFAAFLLENHAPASSNMYLRAAKSAMSTAVRWKLLPSNPFTGGKNIRIPQTLPAYFTKPELEKLLSLIRQNWLKELVIFSVNTGLRQGEVLNLTWDNVDLSRRLIHVELAKGGKRRTVPMNDVVAAMLQTKASRGPVGPVFTLRGKPIEKFSLSHAFKSYVRDAKLPDNLRWHSLRHTHATYLVQAGVPIFSVAKLLGHSDVKVTERHYAALSPENLHDDVNRVLVGTN